MSTAVVPFVSGKLNALLVGCMDVWMNGWMDAWMDGYYMSKSLS